MRADIEKRAKTCSACLNAGKNLKFQVLLFEKNRITENAGYGNPNQFHRKSEQ